MCKALHYGIQSIIQVSCTLDSIVKEAKAATSFFIDFYELRYLVLGGESREQPVTYSLECFAYKNQI